MTKVGLRATQYYGFLPVCRQNATPCHATPSASCLHPWINSDLSGCMHAKYSAARAARLLLQTPIQRANFQSFARRAVTGSLGRGLPLAYPLVSSSYFLNTWRALLVPQADLWKVGACFRREFNVRYKYLEVRLGWENACLTFGSVRFRSVTFGSVRFRSVTFSYVQLRSITFGYVQLRSVTFSYVLLRSVTFGYVQLRSVTFGYFRLRSVRWPTLVFGIRTR